jgi:hypothetical protein
VSTTTTEPARELRCPRCGANLAPDQDWCLECGAAATTRILRPPSWKLAAGIVLGAVAAVVVVVAIVLNALSDDANHAAASRANAPAAAPVPTPAPAASPSATTASTPTTSTATTATAPTTATGPSASAAGAALATWPGGKTAWTVVLATTSTRAAAEQRGRALVAKGVKAGVLDTSRFNIDASGASFVVFEGQFPSQDAAIAEETRLGSRAPASVFVAEVSPR